MVEVFSKQTDSDRWRITQADGLDASVLFHSLDITLGLAEVYQDVEDRL